MKTTDSMASPFPKYMGVKPFLEDRHVILRASDFTIHSDLP